MKKIISVTLLSLFLYAVISFHIPMTSCAAFAEGLLKHNSEPSSLQNQELDDAYTRGYYDGKNGNSPIDYTASDNNAPNGELARGAGRGALGGAAMGSLSGGEAGRGAAWGAGMGAAKAAIKRKRAAEEERNWAQELNNAYNKGYMKGVNEKNSLKGAQ